MPKGQDHVATALSACRQVSDGVKALQGIDEAWRGQTIESLNDMQAALEGMKGRFFIRSKLCLPFAARVAKGAQALAEAQSALSAGEDAQQQFANALVTLQKAVRVLDERSAMQGMAIT